MIYKTHISLNILFLQVILRTSNVQLQEIMTPWGIGILSGTIVGSFIPDIDAPKSEISKRLLPAKTLLNLFIPLLSIILTFSIFTFLHQSFKLTTTEGKSITFLMLFMIIVALLNLLFNILLKPLFEHRGFLHSLTGLIFLNILFLIFYINNLKNLPINFVKLYNGFYVGINIGYIGHIIGDSFTYQGIRPFYPAKWRLSLKIFRTNSPQEKILFYILNLANFVLFLKNILQ
ncbi:metal-dependent hydrolase [Dictyoglomus thermophilum]|uniref:Membrane protein, putative n=1 Tax=Dictyoglomus thermophilum (strain ATCC 35947 / DSM 3960 / H-6-12) TaxID=309799 RepID=B5YEY7_DICT6|nr:metal-dependent hydrolase [Dictyoglomus thermophilum]ACI19682.1 membrane protein, putative [Dictyoglomus thermophilum H-6-12]